MAAYLGVEYDIGPPAALAGGFVSGVVSGNGSLQSGLVGAEFGILNFGIGAGLGEVSASGVLDGNQVPSFVQKIVAHGFVGAIQATYSGQNLGSGFLAGAAQASAAPFITGSPPFRVTEAAAIGGTASVIGGGKFANGAITAAFAQAFNDSLGKGIDVASDASGVNAAMRSFSNWVASNPVQAATLALNFIPLVDLVADAGLAVDTAEEAVAGAESAANAMNGMRLAEQLSLDSANSAFTASGELSEGAIQNATQIFEPGTLLNPAIPEGFGKYTTETFASPSGPFQAHFYMNPATGEVFYGLDYKAIFNTPLRP